MLKTRRLSMLTGIAACALFLLPAFTFAAQSSVQSDPFTPKKGTVDFYIINNIKLSTAVKTALETDGLNPNLSMELTVITSGKKENNETCGLVSRPAPNDNHSAKYFYSPDTMQCQGSNTLAELAFPYLGNGTQMLFGNPKIELKGSNIPQPHPADPADPTASITIMLTTGTQPVPTDNGGFIKGTLKCSVTSKTSAVSDTCEVL